METKGKYKFEHLRNGKIIAVYEGNNVVTIEGKNSMLNVYFDGLTHIAPWYVGIVDSSGFIQELAIDTLSSHPGWSESVAYVEANRVVWDVGPCNGCKITNQTTTVFTLNADTNIKGIFIASNNVKGGTSGVLWAIAINQSMQAFRSGDLFRTTYEVQL